MAEPQAAESPDESAGIDLCASAALVDRGRAQVWDVMLRGERGTAFALRFNGRVVAYVNRCLHMDTEMDWNPGEFLDREGSSIVCSLHGASYEPAGGRCIGGPCGRGALEPIQISEGRGRVRWYPRVDIQPEAGNKASS